MSVRESDTGDGRRLESPIRIFYLRDTLTVCGPGKTMLNTWRTIDRARFDLVIAATRPDPGGGNLLLETARRLGATSVEMGIGRGVDMSAVRQLIRLLRERRIDILQTHDAQTRRIGALAAKLTGTTHVTSVEGWIFNDAKQKASTWLDKRLIGLADAVIAVSGRLKADLEAAGVPARKITVLHNSMLLDDCLPPDGTPSPAEWRVDGSRPVVSIVGRLSEEKGHRAFLEAAQRILRERPETRFLIVGEGPLEADLRMSVARLSLSESVVFTGHRADMARIYNATDVLVISSSTEGLPYVLLEASAYGTPTVATTVGGIPEVIRDGVTGWLVGSGDVAAIADRVLRCLADPTARAKMGAAARTEIERRFDFRRRTRALEQLYERVAASKSVGRAS